MLLAHYNTPVHLYSYFSGKNVQLFFSQDSLGKKTNENVFQPHHKTDYTWKRNCKKIESILTTNKKVVTPSLSDEQTLFS